MSHKNIQSGLPLGGRNSKRIPPEHASLSSCRYGTDIWQEGLESCLSYNPRLLQGKYIKPQEIRTVNKSRNWLQEASNAAHTQN
jgi:hypothetical protein